VVVVLLLYLYIVIFRRYSSFSRIVALRVQSDPSLTYEGENNVLIQQTAKYLLDVVRFLQKGKDVQEISPLGTAAYVFVCFSCCLVDLLLTGFVRLPAARFLADFFTILSNTPTTEVSMKWVRISVVFLFCSSVIHWQYFFLQDQSQGIAALQWKVCYLLSLVRFFVSFFFMLFFVTLLSYLGSLYAVECKAAGQRNGEET
jgi:hypothetical protein